MARVKQDQQSEQVERNGSESGSCCCWQVNSLPSMWYGMLAIALQVKLTLPALNGRALDWICRRGSAD